MKILKFGGTSVGTPESFLNVAGIIEAKSREGEVIVVLSAIGGITDKILKAIELAVKGDRGYLAITGEIKQIHLDFLEKVVREPFIFPAEKKVSELITFLFEKLRGIYLLGECSPRISDSVISAGELLSNNLMVNLLRSRLIDSRFYDARQFIKTDSNFGDATVNFEATDRLISETFARIEKGEIPLVNGFTGTNEEGDTTTLGRSGSDYTATILGGALKCELVEIWTDVDGVLSADPKLVPDANTIDSLSYEEAGSLALLGGKVIHPKTIVPVEKERVPVAILNTFNPAGRGTFIGKSDGNGRAGVKTITYLHGLSIIRIEGIDVKYSRKIHQRIFSLISRSGINPLSMTKSVTHDSVSFIVQTDQASLLKTEIEKEFVLEFSGGFIEAYQRIDNLSLISVICSEGGGTEAATRKIYNNFESTGIAALLFLHDLDSLSVSFLIERTMVGRAVESIHDEFFKIKNDVNVA